MHRAWVCQTKNLGKIVFQSKFQTYFVPELTQSIVVLSRDAKNQPSPLLQVYQSILAPWHAQNMNNLTNNILQVPIHKTFSVCRNPETFGFVERWKIESLHVLGTRNFKICNTRYPTFFGVSCSLQFPRADIIMVKTNYIPFLQKSQLCS